MSDNDTTNDDVPHLVALNANSRPAPESINLDVSGTTGPDYLGQETTDVDGHRFDRPGVQSSLPEDSPESPQVERMDTGETLPVLLESDMRADPIEGTQGNYSIIVEGECARCGYDRLKRSVATMPGEQTEQCMACHARQKPRAENGYSMPTTRTERAEMKREAGPKLGEVHSRDVVDLEPDTGYGPRVALVGTRNSTSLWKEDVETLYWMLAENGDIDVPESIRSNNRDAEQILLGLSLLPEKFHDELGTDPEDVADDGEVNDG